MKISDYGLSFEGFTSKSTSLTYEDFIKKLYVPGGTSMARYISVYWHKEPILRVRVKASPSIKTVFFHISKEVYLRINNPAFKRNFEEALPKLEDYGKLLVCQIKMEK